MTIRIDDDGNLRITEAGFDEQLATAADLNRALAEAGLVAVPREELENILSQCTDGLYVNHDCAAVYALSSILVEPCINALTAAEESKEARDGE